MDDTTKQILIVVSTHNRKTATGITLNSISRNKCPTSNVLILDDASTEYSKEWLERWGFPVERRESNIGVGASALERYMRFLASPARYEYLCAVDSDMIFAEDFDTRCRALWMFATRTPGLTILSGYRSVTYEVKADHGEWLEVDHIGGAMNFVDRATARHLVGSIPTERWNTLWDYNIAGACARRIVPKHSLAEHIGIHGEGVHGESWDIANGFNR